MSDQRRSQREPKRSRIVRQILSPFGEIAFVPPSFDGEREARFIRESRFLRRVNSDPETAQAESSTFASENTRLSFYPDSPLTLRAGAIAREEKALTHSHVFCDSRDRGPRGVAEKRQWKRHSRRNIAAS